MHGRARKLMMAGLVTAFITQTTLVYTDDTSSHEPRLGELELRGRALWHSHNCYTCHQLYGFGGFLGPDLTNAAPRLTRARLDEVLTQGSLQMPPFHLGAADIDAIEAFLRAMDKTGIGQARAFVPPDPAAVDAALEARAAASPLPDDAARGRLWFKAICATCHRLFQPTPLGPFVAPDLSTAWTRLGRTEVERVLAEGRPSKGMPTPPLTEEQRAHARAFLAWLGEHGAEVRARLAGGVDPSTGASTAGTAGAGDAAGAAGTADAAGTGQGIPWFEFR